MKKVSRGSGIRSCLGRPLVAEAWVQLFGDRREVPLGKILNRVWLCGGRSQTKLHSNLKRLGAGDGRGRRTQLAVRSTEISEC